MSFLPISEENKDAPTGQTTNAPNANETPIPPQTGGSVGEEAAGAPAKTSSAGSPTQFGSSASKLGDYLSANAPQIQNQADTLTGNLNTQYGNLNQGITDAANKFQQSVQGGYAANNPDVVNQAVADPTKFAADPNNVAAFQGQYNNAYTGPANFEGTQGYSDLQGQVGNAVTQGNLLGTQAGLQSYLQGQGTNPTQAMSTLDSLLLRGNPGAQQQINTAAGQFGNLTGQLGTATTNADQSVADAQKAAAASQAYAQGQFNPVAQQFNTGIQDAATQAEAQRQGYNTTLAANQNLSSTGRQNLLNTKQTDLSALQDYLVHSGGGQGSLNDPYAQNLMGEFTADPSQYDAILGQQMNNKMPTAANTATAPQYAEANALSQLLGQGYTSPLDQTMISQAGTYQAQPSLLSQSAADTQAQGQMSRLNDFTTLGTKPLTGMGPLVPIGNTSTDPLARAQFILDAQKPGGVSNGGQFNINYPQQDATYNAALQRLVGNSYGI